MVAIVLLVAGLALAQAIALGVMNARHTGGHSGTTFITSVTTP
jgi:hypothetical protein